MRTSVINHSIPLSRVYEYPASLPPPPIPVLESKWALFLDVDGTLLEFADTPDAVTVPDGLIELLGRLHTRLDGALALVSGRRIETLDQLFAPLQLPCAGLHGLERRDSVGHEMLVSFDTAKLSAMRTAARQLAQRLPQVLLEDKNYSIAFHFRAAKLQQPALRAGVEAIAHETGFAIQAGVDVYELKPAGSDKGSALTAFMRDSIFHGRLPIYIGDDLTDEHALSAAQKHSGLGIHVGSLMPSAARFGLPGPGAVLHWLRRWEEQLS